MSALAHATVVVARFLTTAALLVGGANGALAADPGSGPLGGVWLAEDAAPATGSAASGAPAATTVVVGGDIASCSYDGDSKTADLVAAIPGIVMTAGDNVYQKGSWGRFRDCYAPTWGRFRDRTRPTPGNHDWAVPGAAGYFKYFGALAGPAGRGYYAFDAGTWRVYALSGDCWAVGGCQGGSAQYRWLKASLAAHPAACVLAVWHEPRFSSGPHGSTTAVRPLLKLLYAAGAEIVVNGHDHEYERFAPASPNGAADPVHGIRQFVVGTGGAPLYTFSTTPAPNSEVRNNTTRGVLKLTLGAGSYSWAFVPVAGNTFTDSGSGSCHGAPPV